MSAVTAAHCAAAAAESAPGLGEGTWFFDLNSSSPAQKQESARVVESLRARLRRGRADVAHRPPPAGVAVPARRAPCGRLRRGAPPRGASPTSPSSRTRSAAPAASKLCRSVIIKGLESLLTESLLAARHYGVEKDVLDSLSNILPPADWEAVATYFISRSLRTAAGAREEMLEAAATVGRPGSSL